MDGRTRLVSDLMAVEAGYRGGIGFALKGLQAVVAFQGGFEEIVWTFDPLRAANARLNFERLGAHASKYMRNVYGEHFGEGLYGSLPSDRLFVTWPIRSARVRSAAGMVRAARARRARHATGICSWHIREPGPPRRTRRLRRSRL